MRRLLPRTLFAQLVLATVLVQTLLLGFFLTYIVVSQRETAHARTRDRISGQLSHLAAACSRQLSKGDTASLQDVLDLSHIAPSIETARLTDLAGKTMALSQNGADHGVDHGLDAYELAVLADAPTRQQIFSIRNGQQEAVTPIRQNGRAVALLWLEPNHALALSATFTIVNIALSYGGFALLANLIPIFLIVRTMIGPLRKLREATQNIVRRPAEDAGFPLPVSVNNEAGELTTSFNIMVRELGRQRSGLLETLALLDSMLGNAPIGFAFLDRQFCFVRLNEFLADLFAVSVDDSLGQRASELFPGVLSQQIEARIAEVFRTGDSIRNVEISNEAGANSSRQSFLVHFYPVRTEQSVRWVGIIVVEITERLQAEETLRRTEKLAATGRLAASIAHEINNPLEAVTNLLYLLRTHQPMDPTAISFVATAQEELARVSEITQQMLRFHRQSTSPQPTNLAELLESVLKLYQSRIHAANVVVVTRFRAESMIFGFNGEIRQVFANLVGNALDAISVDKKPSGGRLMLSARDGWGRTVEGAWCHGVRVFVTDTGVGMSAETRRRVFEAFFTTKQATGTGLGLWVSEEIIRKHAGTVRVRSREGVGTTFAVFFPDSGVESARFAPVETAKAAVPAPLPVMPVRLPTDRSIPA